MAAGPWWIFPLLFCNTYLYYRSYLMPLTVRLDPKLQRALNALAKQRRITRSDVVREALEQYGAQAATAPAAGSGPYAAWVDVLGVVSIGARDPARTTGAQFADLLRDAKTTPPARRRHARRPR